MREIMYEKVDKAKYNWIYFLYSYEEKMSSNRNGARRGLLEPKKLNNYVATESGQLSRFPGSSNIPSTKDLLVIPDLFGNALKLIHVLVEKNILQLSNGAADYNKLVEIYNHFPYAPSDKIDYKALIHQFFSILFTAKVIPIDQIVLLGNDLCSNGNCDYLMLLVIKRLSFAAYDFKKPNFLIIIHSTLDITLIEKILKEGIDDKSIDEKPQTSFLSLKRLLVNRIITLQDLAQCFHEFYKSHLKLIDYRLFKERDEVGITLFTHVPFPLDDQNHFISDLAKKLNVTYEVKTPFQLAATIDRINKAFQDNFVEKNNISALYDSEILRDPAHSALHEKNPVEFLLWNRSTFSNPTLYYDYRVRFCYGAINEPNNPHLPHIINLNAGNTLGQTKEDIPGNVVTLYSNTPKIIPRSLWERTKKSFNEFTINHPYIWGFLKWVIAPAAVATAIVFSGGFAAIPIVGAGVMGWGAAYGTLAALSFTTAATAAVGLIVKAMTSLWNCCFPKRPTRRPPNNTIDDSPINSYIPRMSTAFIGANTGGLTVSTTASVSIRQDTSAHDLRRSIASASNSSRPIPKANGFDELSRTMSFGLGLGATPPSRN